MSQHTISYTRHGNSAHHFLKNIPSDCGFRNSFIHNWGEMINVLGLHKSQPSLIRNCRSVSKAATSTEPSGILCWVCSILKHIHLFAKLHFSTFMQARALMSDALWKGKNISKWEHILLYFPPHSSHLSLSHYSKIFCLGKSVHKYTIHVTAFLYSLYVSRFFHKNFKLKG